MTPFPPIPLAHDDDPRDKPEVDAHLVENAARAGAVAALEATTSHRMRTLMERMKASAPPLLPPPVRHPVGD